MLASYQYHECPTAERGRMASRAGSVLATAIR